MWMGSEMYKHIDWMKIKYKFPWHHRKIYNISALGIGMWVREKKEEEEEAFVLGLHSFREAGRHQIRTFPNILDTSRDS